VEGLSISVFAKRTQLKVDASEATKPADMPEKSDENTSWYAARRGFDLLVWSPEAPDDRCLKQLCGRET
jgi:hypothetical protein